MADRPFDAPNLLRHAAGRLHGFPDISEDLLDAADEIERLRAALEDAERHADLRLMEIERLRGLIDAITNAGLTADDIDEWISYFAVRNALLAAAATKEDDHG